MEGSVSWPQLIFVAVLIAGSFGAASWVLLKLTEILVRMEKLATKDDLSHTKKDLYDRMDSQWNSFMEMHGGLTQRVTDLEIRLGPINGRARTIP